MPVIIWGKPTYQQRVNAIDELAYDGYCRSCLLGGLVLKHTTAPAKFFCLLCQEEEDPDWYPYYCHPMCLNDYFYCEKCYKTDIFSRHIRCYDKCHTFIADLRATHYDIMFPAPFKSFKK